MIRLAFVLALTALGAAPRALAAQEPLDASVALEIRDDDGSPLVGAAVYVLPRSIADRFRGVPHGQFELHTTDELGLVHVGLAPGKSHTVLVYREPRDAWSSGRGIAGRFYLKPLTAGEGAERLLDLAAPEGVGVLLRIVDERGAPIAGATAAVRHAPNTARRLSEPVLAPRNPGAVSTADGDLEVRVHDGVLGLRIHAPGYAPRRLTLPPPRQRADAPRRTVELEPTGMLEVVLVDPAPGVTVRAIGPTPCLDAQEEAVFARDGRGSVEFWGTRGPGAFTFWDLPPGRVFRIVVSTRSGETLRVVDGVCAPAGGVERKMRIDARPCRRITGTLADIDGRPLPGVEVVLHDTAMKATSPVMRVREPRAVTDADGRFEFEGVAPARYRVGPPMPEGRRELERVVPPASVDATDGDPAPAALVERPARYIRVRVETPEGHSSAGTVVAEHAATGQRVEKAWPSGRRIYRVGPLFEGEYELHATRHRDPERPLTDRVRLDAGQEEITLIARAAGTVRVDGLAIAGEAVTHAGLALVPTDGGTERLVPVRSRRILPIEHVPEGTYTLTVTDPRGAAVAAVGPFEVVRGRRASLGKIALQPAARLRVWCGAETGVLEADVRAGEAFRRRITVATPGYVDLFVPPGDVLVTLVDSETGERSAERVVRATLDERVTAELDAPR